MRYVSMLLLFAATARADQFEHYTNAVLAKAIADGSAKEVKEITSDQLGDLTGVLPDSPAAFLIVATNDKRLAKLLVQPARQKIGADQQAPLLLVDKYSCFKGTSDRAVQASGQNLHLYRGLRLSLEIGQVIPDPLPADLAVTAEKESKKFTVRPVGEAKLYTLAKPIAGVVPKKAAKLVVGEAFETRFFAGKYKLHDDGRRSGVLKLEVNESGEITGMLTSDKDGREYEVQGKTGPAKHAVSFTIKFPATSQTFSGYLFTGDGRAIAGTTKMLDREAAFYAERVEE